MNSLRALITATALLIPMVAMAQHAGDAQRPADTDPALSDESILDAVPLAQRIEDSVARNASAVPKLPANLPWPIAGKSVKDIYLSFWADDAVTELKTKCGGTRPPKHLAIDIAASSGTAVYPIASGKVLYLANGVQWGKAVVIGHGVNYTEWTEVLWHLTPSVAVGDLVTTKTAVGTVVHLDPSLGDRDHVHLGIRAAAYAQDLSKVGFDCTDQLSFVNPLQVIGHRDFVLVDGDDAGAKFTGTSWKQSTATQLYHGSGYRVLPSNAAGSAAFTFTIPTSGSYNLYVRWTADPNRTNKARMTVTSGAMKPWSIFFDQRTLSANGTWMPLGLFGNLSGGGSMTITFTNEGTGYLSADAVLAEKQ